MITENLIAGTPSAEGGKKLKSVNPATREALPEDYAEATRAEINLAVVEATEAWKSFRNTSPSERSALLRSIAEEIEALGDTLVERVMAESGLPEARVKGERGRTCGQLRMFADLVDEGSWVEAVIDEAIPDRTPLPRADIRRMHLALGPVAVFTASNFPLAFSTAGGDTASALAAGCPVIVKAHPSHLGTNALISKAISDAVRKSGLPEGVYSTLQGGTDSGQALVVHPGIKAVGFTGSFRGGRALMDAAAGRSEPIPVYAEMGSNNPIFILNEKLNSEMTALADSIAASVNLGAGQFCTNPGMVVIEDAGKAHDFVLALRESFAKQGAQTMLNQGIYAAYEAGRKSCSTQPGAHMEFEAESGVEWKGAPAFARISSSEFLANPEFQKEVFGPFTLLIVCDGRKESENVARKLHGQLTATIMGTEADLSSVENLADILGRVAGRVIYNGVPTGVEVGHAMHHGGPYPASSNARFTSVGTGAIQRFVRPVCYQNAPQSLLPAALRDDNPLGIWRKLNGEMTRS